MAVGPPVLPHSRTTRFRRVGGLGVSRYSFDHGGEHVCRAGEEVREIGRPHIFNRPIPDDRLPVCALF